MNWDAIGAIGQTLGSVAVLVTLGYLAIQQRDTRRDLRRSISQSRSEANRELFVTQATNERLSGILNRVDAELGVIPADTFALLKQKGMAAEEITAWVGWEYANWVARVQNILFIDELPDGERSQFHLSLRHFYGRPGRSRFWYESLRDSLNPDAVRYIDNLLAQPG